MAFGVLVFILNPIPRLSYILIIPFVVAFGVNYPLMITLFSASVDETEQGWVMGVTVALYTLGAGLISLFGGQLMSLDIRWPFFISMASLVLAMIFVVLLWRDARVRALNARGQD